MFDAHRHLSLAFPKENALYATSKKSEWPRLLESGDKAMGGIGILPPELPIDVSDIYDLLRAHPELQIAEVGLDRRYPDTDGQALFLRTMLHIGFELGRSVSLHCVREDGLLLSLLGSEAKYLPPLLWHGCTASLETVTQAVRYTVIPSYGPSLYTSRLAQEIKHLIRMPFVLETDFTGQEQDYTTTFSRHIAAFSRHSGYSEEQLETHNNEIRAILTHNQTSR
ncbi:TatD family hydrolase [Sphaerochaeta globosa]|uniref:TatD-related deoxyribonuclease n=1 Tax=Sphaerochaeta globosa (strain ATCC BAA-1886 / DSM 22777 / Buddy) TaxID=158189 RepID=F0RVG2_SPHGB|nr:TatD family hydrolase [Sphaerochaeta globosa]ADY12954.1 TatD-related deoxyribonuclease [Sphaerochaeta globosa str. Buddy]